MTTDTEPRAVFEQIVGASAYMTLATADTNGRPWASPVWFAHEGYTELFWISRPAAQHSANIEVRPEVAIVVFDSTVPLGTGRAVYMSARAEQVTERASIEHHMEVFSRRSVEQGGRAYSADDVTGDAALRLYRATVSQHWVLTSDDLREPVDLR